MPFIIHACLTAHLLTSLATPLLCVSILSALSAAFETCIEQLPSTVEYSPRPQLRANILSKWFCREIEYQRPNVKASQQAPFSESWELLVEDQGDDRSRRLNPQNKHKYKKCAIIEQKAHKFMIKSWNYCPSSTLFQPSKSLLRSKLKGSWPLML